MYLPSLRLASGNTQLTSPEFFQVRQQPPTSQPVKNGK
jgi:hypothetical protein